MKVDERLLLVFEVFIITAKAGRYTGIKSKRRYFCRTSINIEQKILYRQTDIP